MGVLLLMGSLLAASGCSSLSIDGTVPPGAGTYEIYAAQVGMATERLQALDNSTAPGDDSISEPVRREMRGIAEQFFSHVTQYLDQNTTLESVWKDATASELAASLRALESLETKLFDDALQLSVNSDAVQAEYRRLGLAAERGDKTESIAAAQKYVASVTTVSSLGSHVRRVLEGLHRDRLDSDTPTTPPAKQVFHFLRLHAVSPTQAGAHAASYERAWQAWVRGQLTDGRAAEALEAFAFVCQEAPTQAPTSPQPVLSITFATLEGTVSSQQVARLQEALEEIRSVRERRGRPELWDRALRKAKARLQLAQARSDLTSPDGPPLAMEALAEDAQLAEQVERYLLASAPAIAEKHLDAANYAKALEVLDATLSLGPSSPAADRLRTRFRFRTIGEGLQSARNQMNARAFGSAKTLIDAMGRLARGTPEKRQVNDALLGYYVRYSEQLLRNDLAAAVRVCEEGLRRFPQQTLMQRRRDEALFRLLGREIGNISTTQERLGSAGVLQAISGTVKRMVTSTGTAQCQRLLVEIEVAWENELRRTKDPTAAFTLATELARLNRRSANVAREAGARAIWTRFDAAVAKTDWTAVDACVESYYAGCPEVEPPERFRRGYVLFLNELDRTYNIRKLGRHLTLYATTYPHNTSDVEALITKHAVADTELSAGFQALLRQIGVQLQVPGEDTTMAEVDPAKSAASLTAFIPADEIPTERLVWQKESTTTRTPNASTVPTRGNTRTSTPALPGPLGAALGVVSLLFLFGLPLVSRRRGLVGFPWYVAGAVCIGVTAGFYTGHWQNHGMATSGQAHAAKDPAGASKDPSP